MTKLVAGDKVKSLLDSRIYTVEKADDLNKVFRIVEVDRLWNYGDFEKVE